MATSHKGEGYMSRFRLPLYLQALCDEVPDREFLGSSARIRKDRSPSMAKLIAKAKLALKSKPSSSSWVPPCQSHEESDAIWAQSVRRCKAQRHVTQQQRFMLDQVDQQHATQQQVTPQQHHPYVTTTTSQITDQYGWITHVPTQWHREDTREERGGSTKRIKLAAMG
jgi:hypothetical protein